MCRVLSRDPSARLKALHGLFLESLPRSTLLVEPTLSPKTALCIPSGTAYADAVIAADTDSLAHRELGQGEANRER